MNKLKNKKKIELSVKINLIPLKFILSSEKDKDKSIHKCQTQKIV